MNPVIILAVAVSLLGLIAFVAHFGLYFSRHMKDMGRELTENLKHLNENLNAHLRDSLRLINETNMNIGDRLDSATRVVGDVKEHLGKLEKSNQRLYEIGKDISSLQDLLRAPKIRGGIGEYILEDLLKQILPRDYYILQYEFRNKERVDAAIRFGQGIVPVDAKFPLENFKRIIETDDEKIRLNAKKSFVSDVKGHIKKISDKYIVPDEGTFDFALMYIPAENVYYETIIKDENIGEESGVFQYAINKKVIPVSPNSFYAYLKVILLGLKGMAIEKSAKEILFNISHLRGGLDKFSSDFVKVGKHLDNAKTSFLESEKKLIKFSDKLTHIESLEKSESKVERIEE
ncbi:MAG: DNA recombination protein RmuC [Candidatus Omnitrophica bacterium]|nr:DNA recombination protein RmuC [Candidatus Omnitrophota bacterium]